MENFRFSFKIIYAILGAVNKSELLLPRKAHLGSGYSMITLKKPASAGITAVNNLFIDQYMPDANGEFVKIYLYLLRNLQDTGELTISSIADIFDHTENDVRRALVYWEKQGLLILSRDSSGEIREIAFTGPWDAPDKGSQEIPAFAETAAAYSESAGEKDDRDASSHSPQEASQKVPKREPRTADRIDELRKQEDIEQLLFIAAQYIGRPLSSAEISDILYYYDGLHFSADLIEYLVEYCVSKGNKSRHYMEKVAIGWAGDGISTVQEAKASTNLYNKKYYSVLNAFGIKNRGPAAPEREYIDRWFQEYQFDLPVIVEACSRTIAQIHEPSFQYTDKILKQWQKKGVRHINDIPALDAQRARAKKSAQPKPASNNRFNNFHQRDYDFEQLEKQLLNS